MFDMDQKIDFQAQENATKMIGYVKKAAKDPYSHHGGQKAQRPFLPFKRKIRAKMDSFAGIFERIRCVYQ